MREPCEIQLTCVLLSFSNRMLKDEVIFSFLWLMGLFYIKIDPCQRVADLVTMNAERYQSTYRTCLIIHTLLFKQN